MKKKHLLVGSLITITVFGAYGVWRANQQGQETPSSVGTASLATESKAAHQSPTAVNKASEASGDEVPPPMIQYVGPVKPDTSAYGETADIYRTYDIATLEELASGGDLIAIKVLADRMSGLPSDQDIEGLDPEELHNFRAERKEKRDKYLDLAITYGDTELASYSARLSDNDWAPGHSTQEEIRNSLLERLAFWEFIAMRGNQLQKFNEVPSAIREYSDFLDEPLTLTAEDKAYIRDRAQAIYDGYEAQREELGLGPFEDTQEEIVSHYPGHSPTQEYMDEMGDNAF